MLRLGFQPLLSSVKILYFLLKSDGVLRLENRLPKSTGVRIPLPAPKNKDTPWGCPLFFVTVRGDELPFALRNGEFAYRRHIACHEEQINRGICVARRCRLKFAPTRNVFHSSLPEQHTPLPSLRQEERNSNRVTFLVFLQSCYVLLEAICCLFIL